MTTVKVRHQWRRIAAGQVGEGWEARDGGRTRIVGRGDTKRGAVRDYVRQAEEREIAEGNAAAARLSEDIKRRMQ